MSRLFSLLFLLIGVFFLMPETLVAQQGKGSVKGFVRDSTTGEALSLVNVVVKGMGQGAATDSRGFYFISNIHPGKIVLRVSLVGYATKEVDVEVVAGKVATANIRLAPVVYQSGTVTATAQRRARYDTEISTQPIGSTEIEVVPAAVEADLFRTISILPGVVSTSDVTSQFYVRGGGGDQNMIILDGMTIYNPFHALGLFSIFDADAVKEAEVLKGGFPAQYGNRLSSIINIKTREGNARRFAGKVSASFLSVKASAEGPTPWKGSWIVSARKSTFNEVLKKFVRTDVPFDFYDVIARANVETGDAGRLSVHMLLSGDQIIQSNAKSADYFWDNRGYSLTWFQVLESRYFIDASVSFSSFKGELRPKAESEISRRLSEVEEVYFNGTINYFRDDGDSYGAGFMFRLPRYHF
ncbi:MAG: TonB-dependent receptor plug domain-containing protein, partial [Chlorobi bacterium]|nr:TonB-dependent receptor plug domain-containing protein [Chlorobiota bacterium]